MATILADLVERFDFEVVRGSSSSSRKGASAIRQLAEVIAGGTDIVVITPDGPRGPVYELGQGLSFSRSNRAPKWCRSTWNIRAAGG